MKKMPKWKTTTFIKIIISKLTEILAESYSAYGYDEEMTPEEFWHWVIEKMQKNEEMFLEEVENWVDKT